LRLTSLARELGLVDEARWRLFERKRALADLEVERLKATRVRPGELPPGWADEILGGPLTRDYSAFELLLRPEVGYDALTKVVGEPEWARDDDRLPSQ